VLVHFKPNRNPIWPPWPLIGWHILNFFSRMVEGIYSNLVTNVPYEFPTKGCYFWSRLEIQYGRRGLWLANTFLTSSPERLKGSTLNLPHMILMSSWQSVVTFEADLKSNMAALSSDWLTHFQLLKENGCRSKSSVAALLLIGWHTKSL